MLVIIQGVVDTFIFTSYIRKIMTNGVIIGGDLSKIIMRQKAESWIEVGELLIANVGDDKILMKVFDICYGSQFSRQNLELISGMHLEDDTDLKIMDPDLRNYKLAMLKPILHLKGNSARTSKILPAFFSEVRKAEKEDFGFLKKTDSPMSVGKLRSGSKIIDFEIKLDGKKVFSEHVLVAATTGRGKSNLTKCMLWDCADKDYCGTLVLDPHDEYYGRTGIGLKEHPAADVIYYTPKDVPSGCKSLKLWLGLLLPKHFDGVVRWSDPQRDALYSYHKKYNKDWIQAIISDKDPGHSFNEATIGVVKRKIMSILNLQATDSKIESRGVWDTDSGKSTINEIINELHFAKTVIIDTSSFSGPAEILIGSIITSELLNRHKYAKQAGRLGEIPSITIVLEEAPRVLGKEVLETGPNIFSTIAREGRKFKIGLYAITQLPSLIPRQILANMNTKIILGIEMAPERQAIIESASHDITEDSKAIASLDKGEAIITSNFTPFAMPIKIPLFKRVVAETQNKHNRRKYSKNYSGINMS